jgi:hypothetical protein
MLLVALVLLFIPVVLFSVWITIKGIRQLEKSARTVIAPIPHGGLRNIYCFKCRALLKVNQQFCNKCQSESAVYQKKQELVDQLQGR